ncbi:MAG: hypothetical protein QOF78_1071, partial [Phycisphaerales bacterium]|nr:hypothetical protein [Phycisphaerales bacterium]
MNDKSTVSIQRVLRGAMFVATAICFGALAGGCQQEMINHGTSQRAEGLHAYEDGQYADAAGSF